MTDKKRKHVNTLTMEHRIRMLDWLRLHADDLPNLTSDEVVAACSEEIGHSCSLTQIRETAKAARLRWVVKRNPQKSNSGTAGRMDKLEARIAVIEKFLNIPANVDELPTDDDLDKI